MSQILGMAFRRVLLTLPALLAMSVLVFLMLRLVPGDPVRSMLGLTSTEANVAIVRAQLGLDEPLSTQYLSWLTGVLHGNLGQDYVSHVPLTVLLSQRLPVTLELAAFSMVLAIVVGVPLGILGAVGGRTVIRLTDVFVIAGVSIPSFVLGLILVLIFTGQWRLLPAVGYVPVTESLTDNLRFITLPVITLAFPVAAYFLNTTREAMRTVMRKPYITFLRAKGIPERRIILRHGLRNASVPIVTVMGIQFGALLGGAIIIETLFALPGVGLLIVTAILERNYPVVQGGVLVVATFFILANLVADLLAAALSPATAATIE